MLERLVRELGGTECNHFKVAHEPLKATAATRQFGEPVTVLSELREVMARHAARAAERIRAQRSAASHLIAFAHGSRTDVGSAQKRATALADGR